MIFLHHIGGQCCVFLNPKTAQYVSLLWTCNTFLEISTLFFQIFLMLVSRIFLFVCLFVLTNIPSMSNLWANYQMSHSWLLFEICAVSLFTIHRFYYCTNKYLVAEFQDNFLNLRCKMSSHPLYIFWKIYLAYSIINYNASCLSIVRYSDGE